MVFDLLLPLGYSLCAPMLIHITIINPLYCCVIFCRVDLSGRWSRHLRMGV